MGGVKAVAWFHIVFKGSVEPFDELVLELERFRFPVEVLESDDLVVLER